MPQSLARILIHLVFSTKHRRPILPLEPFNDLHKYAHGIFKDQKCHMIEMNNVADHVHILFDLHRTACISEVVMHVKKGTSRWLKEQSSQFAEFDWQDGYGAFSLGQSQREDAVVYIRNQQKHHRKRSFQKSSGNSCGDTKLSTTSVMCGTEPAAPFQGADGNDGISQGVALGCPAWPRWGKDPGQVARWGEDPETSYRLGEDRNISSVGAKSQDKLPVGAKTGASCRLGEVRQVAGWSEVRGKSPVGNA